MNDTMPNFRNTLRRMPDHALLALLLTETEKRYLSLEKCAEILRICEDRLQNLFTIPPDNFSFLSGEKERYFFKLFAARELVRRVQVEEVMEKPKISNSRDAYALFSHLAECEYEEFWIAVFNRANKVISKHKISEGGISGTVVDVRRIFKHVINGLGSGLVLCHNHPSGNTIPSEQDISITRKIVDAGKLFEITVLDHIIVGESGFYSFADNGLI